VNIPVTTNKFTGEGYACESGNIFTNCGANSITQTGCDFWTSTVLPYSYTLDAASSVITIVPPNVGVGKVNVGRPSNTIIALSNVNTRLKVYQNFPNPANSTTVFRIYTPVNNKAEITLFDVTGKKIAVIANKILSTGEHDIQYNTARLNAGMYVYEVKINGEVIRKTMVVQ
jgi:hypothetical protein